MKISIITVAYNSAQTIGDTLDSVAAQSYQHVEHIVVDGQSTDDTLAVLQKQGCRVSKVVCEADQGIYEAMNKGLALAEGDVIGILNADDVYAENSVIEQVASVFEDTNVEACYADLVYVDRASGQDIVRYWRSGSFQRGLFSVGWSPPHPTFFVRRSVYERYGGFDLSYKLAADVELMMRFLEAHQIKTKYVPRTWVKMRAGGTSNGTLRNIVLQNVYIARAVRQHRLPFNPAAFLLRKVINRARQLLTKPT